MRCRIVRGARELGGWTCTSQSMGAEIEGAPRIAFLIHSVNFIYWFVVIITFTSTSPVHDIYYLNPVRHLASLQSTSLIETTVNTRDCQKSLRIVIFVVTHDVATNLLRIFCE